MKKVMVFGAFDGLHPGHLDFFRQAKKHGDFLIVSVATDANVVKFKKRKSLFSQRERLDLVSGLKIVNRAVLGTEENFFENHIKKIAPDVIVLGYDQWAQEDYVRQELDKVGLVKTRIIRAGPYQKKIAKSTILKQKSVDFN